MKPALCALSILLALSVSACGETESPVQSSKPATPAIKPTADLPVSQETRLVHTKVAPGKGTPIALKANQSASGSFMSENAGQLDAFGVRIGNYRNTADGALSLELCIEGACQNASKPLPGSKDNDFLVFELAQPTSLAKGQKIDYTLTRSEDATNRAAVWAYPAPSGQVGLTTSAGKTTNLVPRLVLHFQK